MEAGLLLKPETSDFLHLRCLQPLRATLHLELDFITLVQASVAVAGDGFEVDENILATIALDEAITLGSVEPFNSSSLH